MLVERTIAGMIVISELVGGHLVTRKYMGYSLREAKRLFREEVGEWRYN